jgi:hypothetical protein
VLVEGVLLACPSAVKYDAALLDTSLPQVEAEGEPLIQVP